MLVVLFLALTVAPAQEFTGWAELRSGWQLGVDGRPWQLIGVARPSLDVPIRRRFNFSVTPQLSLIGGREASVELRRTLEESEVGPLIDATCTWPEGTTYQSGLGAIEAHLTLERLYADVYTRSVDLRVGRQALLWGSGLMIHPTNPFDEVLISEPWRQRRGVNAVRATVPLGEIDQLQLVLATDDTFRKVRAALRGTANVGAFDVSMSAAYRQDDALALVGLDVKGTAVVGLWFEGALQVGGLDAVGPTIHESFVVGLDYSFPVLERIYVAAQYLRQGAGTLETDDPAALVGRLASTSAPVLPDCGELPVADLLAPDASTRSSFGSPFIGRDYSLLSVNLGLLPELSVTLVDLHNLDDGTGIFVPTVSTHPTGWLDVSLTAQVPYRAWGDGGEFSPSQAATTLSATPFPGLPPVTVDLGRLVPAAQLSLWTRINF